MYLNQLCAFRCLALHRGHNIKAIDGPANEFYLEWMEHARSESNEVTFQDFPDFENLFEVNLEIYSLEEDDFARAIYKSRGHHESTMYVNLYQNHLLYIRDFALYAQNSSARPATVTLKILMIFTVINGSAATRPDTFTSAISINPKSVCSMN